MLPDLLADMHAAAPTLRQVPQRSARDQLTGRGRGVVLGSIIALGWAAFGAFGFPLPITIIVMAVAVLVTAGFNRVGRRMVRQAGTLPRSTTGEKCANDRAWQWFWLNLLGEILLLNLAVYLLCDPSTAHFLVPVVSVAVGLHFLPMAVFFRVRSYGMVGAAMLAVAMICALTMSHMPEAANEIGHLEAFANALILWCSLFHGSRMVVGNAVA